MLSVDVFGILMLQVSLKKIQFLCTDKMRIHEIFMCIHENSHKNHKILDQIWTSSMLKRGACARLLWATCCLPCCLGNVVCCRDPVRLWFLLFRVIDGQTTGEWDPYVQFRFILFLFSLFFVIFFLIPSFMYISKSRPALGRGCVTIESQWMGCTTITDVISMLPHS